MSNDMQEAGAGGAVAAAEGGTAACQTSSPAARTPDGATLASPGAGSPAEAWSELDPLELRAWRGFLQAHARVTRRLEADLLASHDLPLAEYDVLVQLALADGRRLRMHELADHVLLSRAGVTRLVDRLVVDGLVERAKCGADARGSYAVLTGAGLERLRAAAPCHLASVRRHFLDAFERDELEQLSELLGRPQTG